jgi:uncharacterized protein YunC (DUF1805 family)
MAGGADVPLVVDSVTRFGPDAAGRVCVGASHAGVYAAYLCAKAGLRGAVLHDAGVGKDGAGVAGLHYLDALGVPAAAIDHRSAVIGDGADCIARGALSRVNAAAEALGLRPGMAAREAAALMLERAPPAAGRPPPARESRFRLEGHGAAPVWALDSASLLSEGDRGAVAAIGSHGNLLGGRPETAAKAEVFAALFNDAGLGPAGPGATRLPALDARGIAAATVSAASARIGDGRSTAADGVLSRVNATAARLGLREGMDAPAALARLAEAWGEKRRA